MYKLPFMIHFDFMRKLAVPALGAAPAIVAVMLSSQPEASAQALLFQRLAELFPGEVEPGPGDDGMAGAVLRRVPGLLGHYGRVSPERRHAALPEA